MTDQHPEEQKIVADFRFFHRPHWTQADAAAWWGVTERTWRRWERGEAMPQKALLKRIAASTQQLRRRQAKGTHTGP